MNLAAPRTDDEPATPSLPADCRTCVVDSLDRRSWARSHFHPQPFPNHSTVWTASLQIKQGPSEASQCSLRSGLPSSFLLQRLLLCPSLRLLLLLPILLKLLHLLTNLFLFLQKLTLRGCSRRANAVFRMASDQKQLPEAVRDKPMQSSE